MDAPRCGLCGERHWFGEGHRWRDGDVFATGPMAKDVANKIKDMANQNKVQCVDRGPEPDKQVNIPIADQALCQGVNPAFAVFLAGGRVGKTVPREDISRLTTYRYRDIEKRRTYQRELMRKRRGK